jgi:single-strand DNA-binding protein
MNHFFGIGRLTRDAELKTIASGTPCVNFSICINKVWKKDGERQEKPNFFNCTIWGKYGESMHKYLTKGKQIGIEGELSQNTWTDSNGGNHSAVIITVNEISLLSSPKGKDESDPAEPPPPKNKNGGSPGADDIPF